MEGLKYFMKLPIAQKQLIGTFAAIIFLLLLMCITLPLFLSSFFVNAALCLFRLTYRSIIEFWFHGFRSGQNGKGQYVKTCRSIPSICRLLFIILIRKLIVRWQIHP